MNLGSLAKHCLRTAGFLRLVPLLFVATRAFASPEPAMAFQELVAQSSTVVVADVARPAGNAGRGTLAATTVETLRGTAPRKLTVTWSEGKYDEWEGRGRYVLFLNASAGGAYTPSAGSWGFWKVSPDAGAPVGCAIAVPVTRAISQIRGLDAATLDVFQKTKGKPSGLRTIICMDRLKRTLSGGAAR